MKKSDKTQPEQPVENPVENSASNPVGSEIETLKSQVAELTADLQRTRADFENYRKATEAQRAKSMDLARQSTILKLLPLLDDFDRAFATFPEQLSPIKKTYDKSLKDLRIELIPATDGTEFNPDIHEAVMVEDEDDGKEVVSAVLRPGYAYEGEVIRPAMVKVKHVL